MVSKQSINGSWPIRTWFAWLIVGGLLSLGAAGVPSSAAASTHGLAAATPPTGAIAPSANHSISNDETVLEEIVDPFEDMHVYAAAQPQAFIAVANESSISFIPRLVKAIPTAVVESAEARGPPSI